MKPTALCRTALVTVAAALTFCACGSTNDNLLVPGDDSGSAGNDATSDVGSGGDTGPTSDAVAMDSPGGDSGPVDSSSCDADIMNDKNNCGGCGILCTGGSCVGGICQLIPPDGGCPQLPPVGDFACLAIDAQSVYWASGLQQGGVFKVALSGGCPMEIVNAQNAPHGVASDGTSLFWGNFGGGEIMKSGTDGSNPTALVTGQKGPLSLTYDAANLYWLDGDGSVWKSDRTGGNVTQLAPPAASTVSQAQGFLAVNATDLYWTDNGGGKVQKVAIAGGTVTAVATGEKGPFGLGLDAVNVYWTDTTGGTVMALPLVNGNAPTILAMGQMNPRGLAVDSTSVYWANGAMAGTIDKVPLSGGSTVTLASGQHFPGCVAVDSTSVYWIENSGSLISKTAK